MEKKPSYFVREATGLVRELGFTDQFFISTGIVLVLQGFFLTALFAPLLFPGAYLPAVFLIGAIPAFAMAYVYGKLSAGIPRSGGDYVWSTRIMGPLFGSIQFIFVLIATITFCGVLGPEFFYYGIAQSTFGWGVAMHSSALVSLSSGLSSATLAGPLTFVVLLVITVGALLTIRAFGWLFKVVYALYFVMTALFIVAVLAIVPSHFPAVFDSAMKAASVNATYNGIVTQMAKSVPANFSLTNTILAGIPEGFTTYIGFNYGAYLAGETKSPKSSLMRALFLSVVVTTILLLGMSFMIYNTFGSTFVNSIAYFYGTNSSVFPVLPTVTMFAGLSNPWIATILGVGIAVTWAIQIMGFIVTYSRTVFAASFDRLLPSALSKVSDRFHAPYWAVILVAVFSGGYVFFFFYYGIIAAGLNTSYIMPIGFALPMIATLLFPVLKRDLFIRAYGSMKDAWKLMLCSAVGAGAFIFYIFAISNPLISGVYIGASLPLAVEIAVGGAVIGGLVYAWARWHAQKMGMNLMNIYAEIPPE